MVVFLALWGEGREIFPWAAFGGKKIPILFLKNPAFFLLFSRFKNVRPPVATGGGEEQ